MRIFHAAGYNVPGSFVLDLNPATDLTLDPAATFTLYEVERRPLTADAPARRSWRRARAARTAGFAPWPSAGCRARSWARST